MTDTASTAARPGTLRVGVISLGCAKNLVDTEVMLGHLDRAGATFVQDPSEADVILVNTCSFIGPAREESVRTILETAELKKAATSSGSWSPAAWCSATPANSRRASRR